MLTLPLALTLYSGFTHAFETDHLLAVSSMVSSKTRVIPAVKDGMYWGFGHTSTILLVGLLVLLLRLEVNEVYFSYFEQGVGLMLILMGFFRIKKWMQTRNNAHDAIHFHSHHGALSGFWGSYSVGAVHGLAGSGALLLLVMSQATSWQSGILYLTLFGLGSVLGMMVAAGAMSLPFSKRIVASEWLQATLVWLSSLLCIGYGLYVIASRL